MLRGVCVYVLEGGVSNKHCYTAIGIFYRYLGGMKEYEVELEFSSAMTAYPDRRRTGGEEYRDGEAPHLGSQSDLSSEMLVDLYFYFFLFKSHVIK